MGDDKFYWMCETVTKEHQRAAFYCMKEDTRVDGPWTDDMDLEIVRNESIQ